ncbi:MAG: ribulokinase [Oscillospiraceae bacterium]|nr:ribulokinase [Oscillospiraceae bacterium]
MGVRYSVGVDFGTLSGRAVLVDVGCGDIVATAEMPYPHAVMDERLPDGTRLGHDWALQHPRDYLDVLTATVPQTLRKAGVDASDVIGMAIDFTACTMLPVDGAGEPLAFDVRHCANPHSWVKLWKHHAAQDEANRLNEVASRRGEPFLARYGGKVSSEWMFPKVMQVLDEAPEIYAAAASFMEATDWVTMWLTGVARRNSCTAGYKALWSKREGYPSKAFFKELDPRLENVVAEKFGHGVDPIGSKAGDLRPDAAEALGLKPGTAVGVANVDAHVAVPAVGITEPGKMLMIMGTSTCHMVLGHEERIVPGMCGVVEDGIIPGLMGFEAGQSCVGDHFDWFVRSLVPSEYKEEAERKGIGLHALLRGKAERLRPGESGLLALDWWNGNRSVLVDADLTGMILGMTLATKPEEIYRALIEATAYGTNMIIETFEGCGVPIREIYACGGIAEKDAMMMQIYADVTGRSIALSASPQTVALGAAMFGAVAAGSAKGGYDDIFEAARRMPKVKEERYRPIPENAARYARLYSEYKTLHDYFGRGGNDVMKRLKALKAEIGGCRDQHSP